MTTINLNNIYFSYPETPDKPVLNIAKWAVAPQEQVFVHGPSGCGKSSLLNLLSGLVAPNQGQLSILGQRLDTMNQRQRDQFRAQNIGYVFQQFNLIPYLNAIENVQLATQFAQHANQTSLNKTLKDLLKQLNLSADDWHKPTAKLSIGQQQRVAIARALINKPQLLIADEPTSSLDQQNRDNFMSILMELSTAYGITLVFVSHDMSLSRYFTRIDAMSDISHIAGAH